MHGNTSSTPSTLLDLPPELRNLIYGHLFADPSQHQHGLFDNPYYHSTTAITATSRQIRWETLSLYKQAIANYWKSHTFDIAIDSKTLDGNNLNENWASNLNKLPSEINVPSLMICLRYRRTLGLINSMLEFGLNTDREVICTWNLDPSNHPALRLKVLAQELSRCMTGEARGLVAKKPMTEAGQGFTKTDIEVLVKWLGSMTRNLSL